MSRKTAVKFITAYRLREKGLTGCYEKEWEEIMDVTNGDLTRLPHVMGAEFGLKTPCWEN